MNAPNPSCRIRVRLAAPDATRGGTAATIGSFDGVHLGHQAMIGAMKQRAAELNLSTSVLTFHPRPIEFFGGDQVLPSIMNWREKVDALMRLGVDEIWCLPFNAKIRNLSAAQFVEQVLRERLNVQCLMVGDDFRFGRDRRGDHKFLSTYAARGEFELMQTATIYHNQQRVSSTRIRTALSESDFVTAASLMGRPFTMSGRVVQGNKVGRTLGAPTANVHIKRERALLSGVFVVRAQIPSGTWVDGVANLGFRPAVDQRKTPLLEVHLFEFSGSLYGQRISVEFLTRLRGEQAFTSLNALKQQIQLDIENAKYWLQETQ